MQNLLSNRFAGRDIRPVLVGAQRRYGAQPLRDANGVTPIREHIRGKSVVPPLERIYPAALHVVGRINPRCCNMELEVFEEWNHAKLLEFANQHQTARRRTFCTVAYRIRTRHTALSRLYVAD